MSIPAAKQSQFVGAAHWEVNHQSCIRKAFRHWIPLSLLPGLALLLTIERQLDAQEVHWNGNAGNGLFFDDNNWSPFGAPEIHDVIRIGNLPGTAGDDVVMGGDPTVLHGGLYLSNGVSLDTNGTELVSFDVVSITGNNTRLIARPAAGPNSSDLQGQIQMVPGTFLELHDNVSTVFFPDSWSLGTISGRGTIVSSNFDNGGVIRPGTNGGIILNAGQLVQNLQVNLDGSNGLGRLDLGTQFSQLQVNAGSLTDSFGGRISMAPGSLLNMNILDGWEADSSAEINVLGFLNPAASLISGSHMTLGGTINVTLAEGKLRILAPLTVQPTASINIGHTDAIEFDGSTIVQGGDFNLERFGQMQFDGPTTLSGGTFNTFANNYTDGTIAFNGSTVWNGNVTINGAARQQGNATVSGLGATINANRFDMDGLSGNTSWNINSNLTINAEMTGTTSSNRFEGIMNIQGGTLPRLNMNLADPNASWVMAGEMNLSGTGSNYWTRVGGSHMIVQGDLNVTGGRVRINSDTTFSDAGFAGPAEVSIGPDDAALRMHGQTTVEAGVVFHGQGSLVNAQSGEMLLEHGLSLAAIELVNSGSLKIDSGAGLASVHGFENTATGIWSVDIGGNLAGAQHDLLIVGDEAAWLDGLLEVNLIDLGLGEGYFLPGLGDTFTILTSLGGVNGTFQNTPTTLLGLQQFHWEVIYNPYDVQLQLAAVSVPEPSAIWLLATSMFAIGLRRRRKTSPNGELA